LKWEFGVEMSRADSFSSGYGILLVVFGGIYGMDMVCEEWGWRLKYKYNFKSVAGLNLLLMSVFNFYRIES